MVIVVLTNPEHGIDNFESGDHFKIDEDRQLHIHGGDKSLASYSTNNWASVKVRD